MHFKTTTRRLLTILIIAAAMTGCAASKAHELSEAPKLFVVNVNMIEFMGMEPEGLLFDVPLELHNLSKGEAMMKEVSLEMALNERTIAATKRKGQLHILPESKTLVHMPVHVDPIELITGAFRKTHTLVFRGETVTDIGILGLHRSKFRSKHVLFTHWLGELSLESISMRKSKISELCLTIELTQPRAAEDPLKWSALTGTIFLNGMRVAEIGRETIVYREGSIRIEVRIPTLTSAVAIAQIVRTRKFDIRIDALYRAETATLKYRVPWTFEKKGISF
jgi:hypothetical protein